MNRAIISVIGEQRSTDHGEHLRSVRFRRNQIVLEESPEEVPGERGVDALRRHGVPQLPSAATAARSPAMRAGSSLMTSCENTPSSVLRDISICRCSTESSATTAPL